jgi:uncharacterized protein (TIGR00255 family)
MTGFGSATGTVGRVHVDVEVRTVNHRFFNPSIKLPGPFAAWESDVRDVLRARIARGHVSLSARIRRDVATGIDEVRLAASVAQLRALKVRFGLDGEVDLATVLRMPDVFIGGASDEEIGGTAAELVRLVETASDALTAMRTAEGARLAAYLAERIDLVEAAVARIAQRAPERIIAQRDRLREAVRLLADGVALDPQRVAQEVAVLADRLDVSEELDRFTAHIAAFRAALNGEGEVGKRLGFLSQELLREANTTGSKANDAAIMHDVVLIKEELERIREQVDNLE